MITYKDLKEAAEYIFKNKSPIETSNSKLIIYEDKDCLYFKIGSITAGIQGFRNLVANYLELNGVGAKDRFKEIYYNGKELSKTNINRFWKPLNNKYIWNQ